tara:strand:+ start:12904 stop:13617 length:714 start_codon:yes stop_codon:yes gene_type:complete
MKVLCSIAARSGSKGIINKNLKKIGNHPLIAYTIKIALSSRLINKVVVNTDSKKIANIAKKYGADVPFIRKPNLADDKTPLLMVTKDTLINMENLKQNYDIVIQLAATCPFISKKNLEESIHLANKYDCCVSLKRIEHDHPYRAKKIYGSNNRFESFIKNINVEKFQSRQDLPELFTTSGGIYTRKSKLLKTATEKDFCFGKSPVGIILNDIESINIDRKIDLEFAKFIQEKKLFKI